MASHGRAASSSPSTWTVVCSGNDRGRSPASCASDTTWACSAPTAARTSLTPSGLAFVAPSLWRAAGGGAHEPTPRAGTRGGGGGRVAGRADAVQEHRGQVGLGDLGEEAARRGPAEGGLAGLLGEEGAAQLDQGWTRHARANGFVALGLSTKRRPAPYHSGKGRVVLGTGSVGSGTPEGLLAGGEGGGGGGGGEGGGGGGRARAPAGGPGRGRRGAARGARRAGRRPGKGRR